MKNTSINNDSDFPIEGVGILRLNKIDNQYFWFGRISKIVNELELELSIEVDEKIPPSQEQVELVIEFLHNKNRLEELIFNYLEESFRGSKWEKKREELEKMYYISAIELKRNGTDFWVVLEPDIYVESIFNFLPRFTITDYRIAWSNVK